MLKIKHKVNKIVYEASYNIIHKEKTIKIQVKKY